MESSHLNKKLIEKVGKRLWNVQGALKGLNGLFTQGNREVCFEGDIFFGIGQK